MKKSHNIEMFEYTCPNCGNILRTDHPEIYHFCPQCAYPIKSDDRIRQKEKYLSELDRCPNCGESLVNHMCPNCGSTVYDFTGEHVRNHNGMTYIRFITESGRAEVLAQVSSHKIKIDNSQLPQSYIKLEAVGSMILKQIADKED